MEDKYASDDDYEQEDDIDEEEDILPIKKIKKTLNQENKSDDEEDDEVDELDNEDEVENDEDIDEDDDDDIIDEDNIDTIIGSKIDNKNTIKTNFPEIIDTDDEDEEYDDDENYLQKFDENIQKNIIAQHHPELISHNYDEIDILSRVVRDTNGVIIDPVHKTIPFITRYEKARILGERAKQINAGAKPTIDIETSVIDGYLIALKEFEEKKIPFIVKRPLPNGGCEYWKFKDLEVLV